MDDTATSPDQPDSTVSDETIDEMLARKYRRARETVQAYHQADDADAIRARVEFHQRYGRLAWLVAWFSRAPKDWAIR